MQSGITAEFVYKLVAVLVSHLHCFLKLHLVLCGHRAKSAHQSSRKLTMKMNSFQPDGPAESTHPEFTPSLDSAQGRRMENTAGSSNGVRSPLFGISLQL